ncbi:MAG: hypothetical protein ACQEV6_13680 [Pseudomonadota bacterium]
MVSLLVMGSLPLTGCYRKYAIETNCFEPFSIEATEYFDAPSPHIWPLRRSNAQAAALLDSGVMGFIVEYDIVSDALPLSDDGVLTFSGNVYKFWPGWAEMHIGGGRKNLQLEVEMADRTYLVFSDTPRNERFPVLAHHCEFAEG